MIRAAGNAEVEGRRVLVRADLNVPRQVGRISDRTRIERFAGAARGLLDRGAAVVVMSHLGRPGGKPATDLSLAQVAPELAECIGRSVRFVRNCVGPEAVLATAGLAPGECALLENLRFHPGEEGDDPCFAGQLAEHGEIFVNDAFSCSHRAHASLHAIARLMPSYAGESLMAEVSALGKVLDSPPSPSAALVGGAKISTKIQVLEHLVEALDSLVIGGGMANTFLAALGYAVGRSLCEREQARCALDVLQLARESGCEVLLPTDVVIAESCREHAPSAVVAVGSVSENGKILDVGPDTVRRITSLLARTRTLLWNGPLGAFEVAPFGRSTFEVARRARDFTASGGLVTVAGGGDTVAALNAAGVRDGFTYVSTAGGAFLEWVEGKELPGILALEWSGNQRERS